MPINPNIAMQLQVPDLVGSFQQGASFGQGQSDRKALRDLMPQAAHGDQQAMDELWAINPNVAQHMDERQRKMASEMTSDLSGAVQWADTPEKWQYVQQHYGQKGVDLSPYGFEDRERGLVALNQISGYLKDPPKMDVRATEPGGGLYGINADGSVRTLVQPNDGSQTMGSPVHSGGGLPRVSDQATYDAIPPGQKYMTPDGQVRVKQGGPTPQASGGFPPSGY